MTNSCNYDIPNEFSLNEDSGCFEQCQDAGCNTDLLLNNNCNAECNLEACGYDWGDCIDCPIECSDVEFSCDIECLIFNCGYSEDICEEEILQKFALKYGLYSKDFRINSGLELCTELGCTTDMLEADECHEECDNEECLYSLGTCTDECSIQGCDKCDDSNTKCFECENGLIQFFTECREKCPLGYEVREYSFDANELFCMNIEDTSSEENPNEYYVSEYLDIEPTGTIDKPFSSISQALGSIYTKYSTVYLMNSNFTLEAVSESDIRILIFDLSNPLTRENFYPKKIIIKPFFDEIVTISITNTGEITFFNIQAEIELHSIVFDASYFDEKCETPITSKFSYCDYCPDVACDEFDKCTTDKSDPIEDYLSDCYIYHNFILINIDYGSLKLFDVQFKNLRIEMDALIFSRSGNVYLERVDFHNVKAKNGVIQINCIEDICGDFTYKSGTVSLLNNGFQNINDFKSSGFIRSEKSNNILIDSITFDHNIVSELNSLIYAKSFNNFQIKNCRFDYNYVKGGLIYLDETEVEFASVDSVIAELYEYNIILTNNSFNVNFVEQNGILTANFKKTLLNIKLTDISVVNFYSENSSIFNLIYLESLSSIEAEGGEFGGVDYQARFGLLDNITITESYLASNGALYMKNMANFNISNIHFTQIYEMTEENYDDFLQQFTADDRLYTDITYIQFNGNGFTSLLYAIGSYNFRITHSEFSNNEIQVGAPKLVFTQHIGSMQLSDSEFKNNTSGIPGPGILEFDGDDCSVRNTTFYNNRNFNRGGYAVIEVSVQSNETLTIEDCVFEENYSSLANSLYSAASNTVIASTNFSHNGFGETIQISVNELQATTLQINSCKFDNNYSKNSGAGISLINERGSEYYIHFSISNTQFILNIADIVGSTIDIAESVFIDESMIDSCVFEANYAGVGGTIALSYFEGLLTIKDSNFTDNTALFGSGVFSNIWDTSTVVFESCRFLYNEGTGVLYMDNAIKVQNVITRNCYFSENKGTPLHFINSKWTDTSSTITLHNFSGVLTERNTIAELSNTVITRNTAKYGAGIHIDTNSVLKCINCTISFNRALSNGGGIYVRADSQIILEDSKIFNNIAPIGSAMSIVACDIDQSYIRKSWIYANEASEATISVIVSKLDVSNSSLYYNIAEESPAIVGIMSEITLSELDCYQQIGNHGGCLKAIQDTRASVDSSHFHDLSIDGIGGGIVCIDCTLDIKRTNFTYIKASTSAGIDIITRGVVTISSSEFRNLNSNYGTGILAVYGTIKIHSSYFYSITNGGIDGTNLENLIITNTTFEAISNKRKGPISCNNCPTTISSSLFTELLAAPNSDGEDTYGGAIYMIITIDSIKISIDSSRFLKNRADNGGAIYMITSEGIRLGSLSISSSEFYDNSAKNGGAIYSSDIHITLKDSLFKGNHASDTKNSDPTISEIVIGRGGAVLITCPVFENDCKNSITHNRFINNTAEYNGGGLCWENVQPTELNNFFEKNHAVYGTDHSSFAIKLQLYESVESRRLSESFSDVRPGVTMEPFSLILVDHYGQNVTTDNKSLATVLTNGSETSLAGTTQVSAIEGVLTFSNLIVLVIPGENITLNFATAGIKPDIGVSGETLVDIVTQECEIGYATAENQCLECSEGTYSLNPDNPSCTACPNEAECDGTYQMYPKKGYWRSSKNSETFWKCPIPEACLGNEDGGSEYTGICAEGYKGNKCQSCDVGYSKSFSGKCAECPESWVNVIRIVATILIVTLVCGIIVKITMDSAIRKKEMYSVYLKIFLNYIQLLMLVATLNLNWPNIVIDFLSLFKVTGTVSQQLISFDCFFAEGGDSDDYNAYYYEKLVMVSLLPLVLFIVPLVFWGIVYLWKRDSTVFSEHLVATIVILFFLIHPTIVLMLFESISCAEINDGEYWLNANLDLRCWDWTHLYYILVFSIPALLIWGIGLPTLCLLYLYRHKRKLYTHSIKRRFGFLYNGYSRTEYYWEFVIIYRKILITLCTVFLFHFSKQIQALTVILILTISWYYQSKYEPYSEPELNKMEVLYIFVAMTTVFSGLYYLTGDLNEFGKGMLFVIIVLVNGWFLFTWSSKMFKEVINMIVKVVPCLDKCLKRKIRDGFPDEIFKLEVIPDHVIGRGNDKLYTIVPKLQEPFPDDLPVIDPNATMKDFFSQVLYDNYLKRNLSQEQQEEALPLFSDNSEFEERLREVGARIIEVDEDDEDAHYLLQRANRNLTEIKEEDKETEQ